MRKRTFEIRHTVMTKENFKHIAYMRDSMPYEMK